MSTARYAKRVLGLLLTLWLLLTPIWISYFSLAGSGPKVAFIPPALVPVALVFTSLWKRLVVHIAGEFEPSYFHPHWGAALPSRGSVHTGLVAAAVGVCIGAIVVQSTFDTAVSNRSATRPANQADLPISVQTETVKSQSFSAEPKAAAVTEPKSTIIVRTEPVKSPAEPTSSDNPDAKRAEAQMSVGGQSSSDQPRCDLWSCERHYRSFRASDCTYQPYGGPRQYCTR